MVLPSESVQSFLDLARTRRVIQPDHIDDLTRRGDLPRADVAAFCEHLCSRGVLTRFQADLVRTGRADELTFAGYPVVDEIGPCPGGTAYRALHPSLRTPIVLRRLRADWYAPADNVAAAVQRAHDACPVVHPHLAHLLDAGVFRDEPFVTLDPFEGADLFTLVREIGPMPASLAAAYGRQLALALAAAHDRELVHGDVRPGTALVGPLTPMSRPRSDGTTRYRPAPTAVVKLFELGLVPVRPTLDPWAREVNLPPDQLAFHAPERLTRGEPSRAGDLYGLGATLYFLLVGQPPFTGADAVQLLEEIRTATPADLSALRPDVPPPVLELIQALLDRDPAGRPTAVETAARLVAAAPAAEQVAPPMPASPGSSVVSGLAGASTPSQTSPGLPPDAAAGDTEFEPPSGWVAVPYTGTGDSATSSFVPPAYEDPPRSEFDPGVFTPPSDDNLLRSRAADRQDRSRIWWWIAVGAGLQILALIGWAVLVLQPGCPIENTSKPAPTPRSSTP